MAVEMALVLPLLVMLLLGVITAGMSYSQGIGLTNAVREGARFGAILPNEPTWDDDVLAQTRTWQFDDPSATSKVCVGLYQKGDPTPVQSTCSTSSITEAPGAFTHSAETPNGACTVRVWAARNFTINAVLFRWDRVMSRTAVAAYERECA